MTLELKALTISAISLYTVAAVEVSKSELVSAWTPDKVTALLTAVFAGLALLITALTGLIAVVWKLVVASRNLRLKTVEVHDAVNGINSSLLVRVDSLTSELADLTGKKADIVASEAAHQDVLEKEKLAISKKVVAET